MSELSSAQLDDLDINHIQRVYVFDPPDPDQVLEGHASALPRCICAGGDHGKGGFLVRFCRMFCAFDPRILCCARNCPKCKTLRRATKQLTLSRLPPVLMIHLKRFASNAKHTDKIESFVDFPRKGLDLTNYMPPSLPPGVDRGVPGAQQLAMDDPRVQTPPYKYDLYGVTNHFGSLSSGHCTPFPENSRSTSNLRLLADTAYITNRSGWLYCDDSRIVPADPKDVVVSISQGFHNRSNG
jgi:hypothetical protein